MFLAAASLVTLHWLAILIAGIVLVSSGLIVQSFNISRLIKGSISHPVFCFAFALLMVAFGAVGLFVGVIGLIFALI